MKQSVRPLKWLNDPHEVVTADKQEREDSIIAGTKAGGLKAAAKNKANNPNFYREIGRKGGLVKGTMGGFAHPTADPSAAGLKGGLKSRRTKKSQ